MLFKVVFYMIFYFANLSKIRVKRCSD